MAMRRRSEESSPPRFSLDKGAKREVRADKPPLDPPVSSFLGGRHYDIKYLGSKYIKNIEDYLSSFSCFPKQVQ